jgi:hypothetical protein
VRWATVRWATVRQALLKCEHFLYISNHAHLYKLGATARLAIVRSGIAEIDESNTSNSYSAEYELID